MNPLRVLIVDDEDLVRWSIRQRLESEGYAVGEAADGATTLAESERGVDLVLLDYQLPDWDGLELLDELRRRDPRALVIMFTAHSTLDRAVQAVKRGAYHFAAKPLDLDDLVELVQRALETRELRREVAELREERRTAGQGPLLGSSPAMASMRRMLQKIATTPASTVLITGESGTGKDLAARAIHDWSGRSRGPFMNITCTALSPTLLESELFGHERGAFTDAKQRKLGLLEMAHRGTVFLDEVGDLLPSLQAKLLRFLQEKAFRRVGGSVDIRPDVRIVAATNRDLWEAVHRGDFREDLYYRLSVLHVEMPALRERGRDVVELAQSFLGELAASFHKSIAGFSPSAREALLRHTWPGNVRELRNAVERATLLCEGRWIEPEDLPDLAQHGGGASEHLMVLPPAGVDVAALERDLLKQALERTGGNRSAAGQLLGMNRDQVRYRCAKFGLHASRYVRSAHDED